MHGIGVSPGISIGPAFVIRKTLKAVSGIIIEGVEMKTIEINKFDHAVEASVCEIEGMKKEGETELHKTLVDILDTQIEFLTDPQIRTDVIEKIEKENKTCTDAVIEVIDAAAAIFENIEDEYLRARGSDIKDIGNRILRNLNPAEGPDFREFPENSIIISEDITPSDTISFDVSRIAGFATKAGSRTSHSAIIAKSRGIPAVVGCGDDLMNISNKTIVLIDGSTGEVIINPDSKIIEAFRSRQKEEREANAMLEKLKELPAITTDGNKITLLGNITGAADLEKLFASGGEGVGLFRTEMLFLGRDSLPGEEEQFNFYREVAEKSGNRPVIIRTLDIGGDKNLPYLNIPFENNPFMGYRAIRFCLSEKEIFMTQLRAILRASAFGNLRIMFPMICNIEEIRLAKQFVQQAKKELLESKKMFNDEIEIGIMIEIPSAALIADQLAMEVNFFSIGTNDLCQYTLAVDRMNERVSSLYNHFDPAVLRLIHFTIREAGKNKIDVGLCGEMASDPLAAVLLIGMGLDHFSMGASSIPAIKNIIRKTDKSKATEIWNRVKEMDNSEAITEYLKTLQA